MTWTPAKPPVCHQQPTGSLALGWLQGDALGAQVLETAHQLMAAQTYVAQALPPALGKTCRVAHIDRQLMCLAVPSAAHAAKLRQLAPTVVRCMNDAGWNITEVQVQVQAHLFVTATKPSTRSVQTLDEHALNAFEQLHQSLPAGPLSNSIERLLKRHRE